MNEIAATLLIARVSCGVGVLLLLVVIVLFARGGKRKTDPRGASIGPNGVERRQRTPRSRVGRWST